MALRVVNCTERRTPWGNGLGESREFCSGVIGEAGWRLSTTRIEGDCPFSIYPSRNRTIVLMAGAGFELDPAGHPSSRVVPPYGCANFSGEWQTHCTLIDGPVEVLNAVVDFGVDYRFSLVANRVVTASGQVHALYALGGDAVVRAGGTTIELCHGEAACIVNDTPLPIDVECAAQSRLALLSLGAPAAPSI